MKNKKIITQIGSLPYDNVAEAVEYSLKHDIPFLPELPKKGDAMMEYIKKPGDLSCLDAFKQRTKGHDIVKIQCVGPATLVLGGYEPDDALDRASRHISAIMDGLETKAVILFLDEPALGQAGFNYKELWVGLFDSFPGIISGVHVCGNMNWDELFNSRVDIISFDASKYDITKYPKYENSRSNGKRIAWGIKERKDVKDFQEGDLLTLPCGIGTKFNVEDDCKTSLTMLVNTKEALLGN